jgi:hypothetical protein
MVAVIATAVTILVVWVTLAEAVIVMWLRLGWSGGGGHNRGSRMELFSCLWLRCVSVIVVGVHVVQVGVVAARVWTLPPRHSCRRRRRQPSHDIRWLANIHGSEEAGRRHVELWTYSINNWGKMKGPKNFIHIRVVSVLRHRCHPICCIHRL